VYPQTDAHDHGMLAVGDRQLVYWEVCGNPDGKPAVVLHGGPGSGCSPGWRRYFDPRVYRVVLFDQRGCGRSRPHASAPVIDLSANTTDHLIADIELLRRHLGIDRWLVLGASWGSTLGLAYAERHPGRVSELVLFAIATTRRTEVEWITRDVGRLFPAQWARFRDGVPEADRDGDLADAYGRLLHDPDPAVREKAARDWCTWEEAHVNVRGDNPPDPRYEDPAFRMCFARLVTHYWRHAGFLDDGALLRDAGRLAGVPGALIHGRLDVSSPLDVPWELSRAWPDGELVVVEGAGHGGPGMAEFVVEATDRFAGGPAQRPPSRSRRR
jgi:proline iminopeptidase